jgi:signal transduction histidine kinase
MKLKRRKKDNLDTNEAKTSKPKPKIKRHPWKVLIVDDEPDVHAMTRFALEEFEFGGRPLQLFNAMSGIEARAILETEPEMAVALIDVVMETDDAGLQLVDFIRNELKYAFIRLIVRTGQPGMAPEQEVIERYDIDDYKNKAELKAQKLFTTMRIALKSYRNLCTLDTSRKGLALILDAAPKLSHPLSLNQFFNGVLTQIIGLCNLGKSSLILTISNSLLVTANGDQIRVQAGTGRFSNPSQNPEVEKIVKIYSERMLKLQSNELLPTGAILMPLKIHNKSIGFIYLEDAQYLSEANQKLIYIMVNQCASALENLQIYLDLKKAHQETSQKLTLAEQARDVAETANTAKSQFLAKMSHELQSSLNNLLMMAQFLANNSEGNLTEKQLEYAFTMQYTSTELLTLMNDISDLSKVESGKMEVSVEALPLATLIETMKQKFKPIAQEKEIAFHITMAEDLPTELHTDVKRLAQIINHLLSNAFKWTKQGEVRLDIKRPSHLKDLSNTRLNSESTIIISITDTGIGIPQDKQRDIFEAFQPVDGTTSQRFGGTGLGLSLSRQLAHLLGGDIQLLSEEGKGSTFTLSLPEAISTPLISPKA